MEAAKPGICYEYKEGRGRKLRQTKRDHIDIKNVLFKYYDFKRPEFIAVLNWFKAQRITETKGVFSDIEEDDLGEVAKFAVLKHKRKKFGGTPTETQIETFKKQRPMGWITQQELKANCFCVSWTERIALSNCSSLLFNTCSIYLFCLSSRSINA